MIAVPAGLPGMKAASEGDSKAIQEFMAFYHILKQQSPLKCISWRIMLYSGQISTMLASAFWENRAKFNKLWFWYLLQSAKELVENLLCIVKEHLLSIEPQLVAAILPPAKRVKNMIERSRSSLSSSYKTFLSRK